MAGAYLAKLIFPISFEVGLLITAGFILSYTFIGGFLAISWLDMFQGCLIFLALLIVPCFTLHIIHLDATASVSRIATQVAGYFSPFTTFSWIAVISLMAWGLGYFGQPHILVRFMAARSARDIPMARLICLFWMIMALFGAVFTGVVGRAYLEHLDNPEIVFIKLSYLLFNPWVAGILISAVLSAIMSSSSAQLLASSSALIEDIYHTFIRRKATRIELIIGARVAVMIIAICAFCLALNPTGNILQLVGYAWAGLGASFGPVVLMSLYWKRMSGAGAIAGMIAAAILVVVWEILGHHLQGIFKLYSMVPAFALNCLIVPIVSWVRPNNSFYAKRMHNDVMMVLRAK